MRDRRARNTDDGISSNSENTGSRSEILKHFGIEMNARAIIIAHRCEQLALEMEDMLAPGPQKSTGLRKLLEAKDCFVRAKLK